MRHSVLFRWALAGFLSGVAFTSFFSLPASALWVAVGVGALGVLIRRPLGIVLGVVLLAGVAGIVRTEQVMARPAALAAHADGPAVTVNGVVDGAFELTSSGRGKFTFRVLEVIPLDESRPTAAEAAPSAGRRLTGRNERIVVYGQDWVKPRFGQELSLTGKLRQPTNSGAFDYVSYLAKDGIRAQMSFPAFGVPDVPLGIPWSIRARRPLFAVRDALDDALLRAVPGDQGAYMAGILVGSRGGITPALADAFSRTGTSHILAISGYNITIVAGALMVLLARFGRRRSYWCTLLGVVAFTLMVGASASVTRAAIMGMLALTAVHLGRTAHAGTGILASAALMAAYNPMLIRWDVGFQLSFLAVVGIVYIEPIIRRPLERLVRKPLAAMAATTIAAQVAVLPLILFDFGTLAVYTLPVNLLVLPLVPLAMALAFATAVSGALMPFIGSLVGQIAWLIAAVQLAIVRYAAALPLASLEVNISVPVLMASYSGLAAWLISVYRGNPEPTPNSTP